MKARNFALTLIAASAMFAFACDDGDSNTCNSATDKAVCVDANTIKICINNEWRENKCATAAPMCKVGACVIDDTKDCTAGAVKCLDGNTIGTCGANKKWTSEKCDYGCDTAKNACKAKPVDTKCTVTETVCVNNALEVCVAGADKKITPCITGCVDGAKVCNAPVKCEVTETKCVNNALEICEVGKDKKVSPCADGCVDGAQVCNVSTKCTVTETKCVNNALEICVKGEDKKIEACDFGCDTGSNTCNDEVIDNKCETTGTACLDNALIKCVIGQEPVIEVCTTGCIDGAEVCNAAVNCTVTETKCVNNALEICVAGKDKVVKNCDYGCKADATVCNEKPAGGSHMCDPALEATYVIGADQPSPYDWCCSTVKTNAAWTSKDGKITQWDCPGGCKADPKDATKMFCDRGTTTGSHMCDPALEATYVIGADQPSPYDWCCSTVKTNTAWTSKDGKITQWDCPGGCKADPKDATKMFCDRGTGTGCTKPAVPAGSKVGDTCDGHDGVCLDKNTWMFCKDGKYVANYCAGDCASDSSIECGYQTCSRVYTQVDGVSCVKAEFTPECKDAKTGVFCTGAGPNVRTITCNAGYKCDNNAGFIGCIPE